MKSYLVVKLFYCSAKLSETKSGRVFGAPIRLLYRLFSRNIVHVELWDVTKVGKGLVLWHGAQGSVVNPHAVIGNNFQLRQNTTIGSASFDDPTLCPTIGDNVQVGPNCTILGKILIGDNVQIGGGAVVVKDVPHNAVVAGNPAKIIKMLKDVNRGEFCFPSIEFAVTKQWRVAV